ncbi:MAG: hypothetical protein ACI4DS_05530 [Eubacterium sp.]
MISDISALQAYNVELSKVVGLYVNDGTYIETFIEVVETKLYNIKQENIYCENMYQFLQFFDKVYVNGCGIYIA